MAHELSELTLEEALRSYSSVKGHRTRTEREIGNLLALLKEQYSATSEERINNRLEKLEKHTHRLADIATYLQSLKYAKARDHLEECAEFEETLATCSEEIFTVLHQRQVANPAAVQPVAAPAQAARLPAKASSSELKPERLTHDASASTFRSWKKCYKAYFDSAQMGSLPCSQQQAYLGNCIDSTLRARIDREATATTPVYSPIVGLFTCISILDQVFLESYPIHVRRKMFFDARQKEGQSALEFREELLSLLEEADGANIRCDDLVCMMLQIGLSDSQLRRELGGVRDPTLKAFSDKIECFEQAKKTEPDMAFGNAATKPPSGKRQQSQGGRINRGGTNRNKSERERRLSLRGKCFRCAKGDHMVPACTYPDSVKCNLCGGTGHITPACSRRQAVNSTHQIPQASSHPPTSAPSNSQNQLAISYEGSNFGDSSSQVWPNSSSASVVSHPPHPRAGVYYTPSNLPTPEMPL